MLIEKNINAIVLMTAERNHSNNPALKKHKVICKPFNSNELKEIIKQTTFVFD